MKCADCIFFKKIPDDPSRVRDTKTNGGVGDCIVNPPRSTINPKTGKRSVGLYELVTGTMPGCGNFQNVNGEVYEDLYKKERT